MKNQLNTHFPGCWVGWDMPFTLALQSQELTPLDLFLQGYVKDMYASHVVSWTCITDRCYYLLSHQVCLNVCGLRLNGY
jgi:hypothetical protein